MEITPVRAPYTDEEYMPLRLPKSSGNTPTHSKSPNSSFSSQASSTVSSHKSFPTTKLSANAPPFTPLYNHQTSMMQQQSNPNQNQVYQQQQQQQGHQGHQNQSRNYRKNQQQHQQQLQQHHHHHQQQQQPQHHHRHQQQQQQQQNPQRANDYQRMPHVDYKQHMPAPNYLGHNSVQGRLKIAASGSPSPSNSYAYGRSSSNNHNNYQVRQNQQHSYEYSAENDAAAQSPAVEVETVALNYLQTVIQCLNQNPGQFDTIATRFLTIFDGMENNNYVLCNAMEDIFNESIQNPNFRYMGAKLYNLLHMLNLKKDSLFHTLLKCKLDYHQKELMEYMTKPNQHHMVRETALFLAELYMQLRGDDSRIHLIAENIVFALKQLLSKESVENVRCICLTLKLAGYDLTADCSADMQQIITQLEAINSQQPGKYPLATNVIQLQKNNWGRKLSASSSVCEEEWMQPREPLRTSDEPIFYGPDGRELTAEEADFLTSHVNVPGGGGAAGSTDEEDVPDLDVDLDPEMDEETEAAYKEFCRRNAVS